MNQKCESEEPKQVVLKALFKYAEALYHENGRLEIPVNPVKVMQSAKLINLETLKYVLKELMATTVEVNEPAELKGIGTLIEYIDFADDSKWAITFGRVMTIIRGIDDKTSDIRKKYDRIVINWQW